MFDIGFSEIVVIAVVALIVIGPERLPKAARTMGHLFGRLQRYVNDVKSDISREMELDELRKLQQEVQTAASDIQSTVSSAARDVQTSVRTVEDELNRAADSSTEQAAPLALPPLTEPPADPPEGTAGATTDQTPASAPAPARQESLPGLDRI